MPAAELLVLALVACLGSAAQSATGFGVALPLAPVALALLPPPDAVLLVAVASLMHNVLVLATRRRRLELWASEAALLIAPALPALALGALIVSRAPKSTMQLVVGSTILLAIALRLHKPGRLRHIPGRSGALPVGAVAGVLTTTVGINGPPLVLWMRARGASIAQVRDTLAVVFLALNVAAVPSLATGGGELAFGVLPGVAAGLIAGHLLGLLAHARLPLALLERGLTGVLLAAATATIVAGAAALS